MPTRTIFFGTPQFAIPLLEALLTIPTIEVVLVVTQPDTLVGRKQILTPPPIKVIAEKHQFKVFQPQTLKSPEAFNYLSDLKPDLIVLAAYGKIIPAPILNLPRYKAVNVHPSALPKYRGATPIQTALLEGETETATSLMIMEPTLDTGPILAQIRVPIGVRETYPELDQKLAKTSAELLQKTLPLWLENKITPLMQDHNLATYTKVLEKADALIDWNKKATAIDCQIRAYTPWPGTYTIYNQKRIKILTAQAGPHGNSQPGTIHFKNKQLFIGCGHNTSLEILTLQEEGKNPLSGKDFIAGHTDWDQAKLV